MSARTKHSHPGRLFGMDGAGPFVEVELFDPNGHDHAPEGCEYCEAGEPYEHNREPRRDDSG